jgi:hypothetical protein
MNNATPEWFIERLKVNAKIGYIKMETALEIFHNAVSSAVESQPPALPDFTSLEHNGGQETITNEDCVFDSFILESQQSKKKQKRIRTDYDPNKEYVLGEITPTDLKLDYARIFGYKAEISSIKSLFFAVLEGIAGQNTSYIDILLSHPESIRKKNSWVSLDRESCDQKAELLQLPRGYKHKVYASGNHSWVDCIKYLERILEICEIPKNMVLLRFHPPTED